MFSKILIIILVIATASSFEPGHEKETYIFGKFKEFMIKYNKSYATIEEFNQRFLIFKANYIEAEEFTLTANSTYSKGITKFSDLTKEEFKRKHTGFKLTEKSKREHRHHLTFLDKDTPPETLDWRKDGAVTPVKDQGQCGSCWAFSAVGNLEGLYFIKNDKLISFSEQELVSCDTIDSGCGGGLMENAFEWLAKNSTGDVDEASYQYTSGSGDSGVCEIPETYNAIVQVSSSQFIGSTVALMKQALSKNPLSVAINADPLQTYTGGIINADASVCDPSALDHGVTLVGYGTDNGQDFWIIKNSWGASWGEAGYFRFLITDDGQGICGINTHVVTAILQ